MRSLNLSILKILIAGMLIPALSFAGESSTETLTLKKCVEIALKENSNVKITEYASLGAKSDMDEAFTDFLPKLSTKASYLRYEEVPTAEIEGFGTVPLGTRDNINFSVDVTQPLFTGGRIANGYSIKKRAYDSAKQEEELRKKEIVNEVTSRYFQLLMATRLKEITAKSRDIIKNHLKDVEAFYEVGMASKNDLLSAKVSLAGAESLLIKASNRYELAVSSLNYSLNRAINSPINDIEDVKEPQVKLDIDLDECVVKAYNNREELKIINNANKINESLINLERSAYYPQLYFIGSYNEAGDEMPLRDKYYSALVTLQLDIFSWGETLNRVESRKMALKRSYENENLVKNSISLEVKAAYLKLKQAAEEITATKQAVEQAEENHRIYDEKFKVNAASSSDVLDAEDLILRSKIDYYRALYDYHIAKADLKRATGEVTY
jgi:outer membrane protein TolC